MGDISKTVVVVLLIATILVSVIGTWVVLNTVDNTIARIFSTSRGHGHVSFTLTEQGSKMSTGEGQVNVNIQPPA